MAQAVDLDAVLAERFGHEAFRPGQREAIEALLAGRDVLLVLPTGAGKSLVYRLAAEVLSGFVVVVSPIIALMRDQVEAARADGQAAERIDSTLGARRIEATLAGVEEGRVRLLYVTPERLQNPDLVARLRAAGPALAVVDEAHVVSEWGHGFRPAYLELAGAVEALGRPPALAATATARAVVALSPVRSTGRRPSARRAATASRLLGLTRSATPSTARARPSHATAIAVRPPASICSRARASSSGSPRPHSASSAGRPTTTARPSTTPSTPRPSRFAKPSTCGSAPAASRAPRATARATGCSDASSTAPASRRTSPRSCLLYTSPSPRD